MNFIQKSGAASGSLARVLPILACDREVIRLLSERLSQQTFSLQGMKRAFTVLEQQFRDISSSSELSSFTLEFTASTLLDNYRASNGLLTEDYRRGPNRNLGRLLTILLDIPPPNADELLEEGSGVGRVSVFLTRTQAEFKSLCINPGDKLFLDSLETNLLRVACDFYWADFICGFLDSNGILTGVQETRLIRDTSTLVNTGRATIPNHILEPLFCFMRYTLFGALHLNKYAAESQSNSSLLRVTISFGAKRKRIVCRLALGFTAAKRRCFRFSRLKDVLRDINNQVIEEQISILESHVVVTCPTRRSVEISRRFSQNALNYLKNSCGFSDAEITELQQNNNPLTD